MKHVDQGGAGIFRITVDVSALHRGDGDLRRTEIEEAFHAHPRALERLRVDLRDDERFGEVLRSDPNSRWVEDATREQRRCAEQRQRALPLHARAAASRPAAPKARSAPSASAATIAAAAKSSAVSSV